MHIAKWLDIKGTNPRKFAIAIGHEPSSFHRIVKGERDPTYALVRATYEETQGDVGLMDWPEPRVRRKKRGKR